MSKNFHLHADRLGESLFRARGHVLAVPCGSGLAILDLDRGAVFAGTPEAAEAWGVLVRDRPAAETMSREAGRAAEVREPATIHAGHDSASVAWVADFLLASRLIEPSSGPVRLAGRRWR